MRLTIRAGQVCELGAFSTPNQAFWFVSCLGLAATESTEEQREQAPPPGFGPFQRRSRAPMPTVRLGCLREAGPTGRTTDRPPLCAEAPDQRCTLGV